MTTNDLTTRARALLDGITPGEWTVHPVTVYVPSATVYCGDDMVATRIEPADAAFIAAAPGLVRDLLARVEQLERGLLPFALSVPSSLYVDDDELTIDPIGPNFIAPVVTIRELRAANRAFYGDASQEDTHDDD